MTVDQVSKIKEVITTLDSLIVEAEQIVRELEEVLNA